MNQRQVRMLMAMLQLLPKLIKQVFLMVPLFVHLVHFLATQVAELRLFQPFRMLRAQVPAPNAHLNVETTVTHALLLLLLVLFLVVLPSPFQMMLKLRLKTRLAQEIINPENKNCFFTKGASFQEAFLFRYILTTPINELILSLFSMQQQHCSASQSAIFIFARETNHISISPLPFASILPLAFKCKLRVIFRVFICRLANIHLPNFPSTFRKRLK